MTGISEDARTRLDAEGAQVSTWGNGPDERYQPHAHDYDKVLVVIGGSITFRLAALGTSHVLRLGDRLDLPAGVIHAADVGPDGVRCLEGHLPAGSLRRGVTRVADWMAIGRPAGSADETDRDAGT